jgi:hypothetical protein
VGSAWTHHATAATKVNFLASSHSGRGLNAYPQFSYFLPLGLGSLAACAWLLDRACNALEHRAAARPDSPARHLPRALAFLALSLACLALSHSWHDAAYSARADVQSRHAANLGLAYPIKDAPSMLQHGRVWHLTAGHMRTRILTTFQRLRQQGRLPARVERWYHDDLGPSDFSDETSRGWPAPAPGCGTGGSARPAGWR